MSAYPVTPNYHRSIQQHTSRALTEALCRSQWPHVINTGSQMTTVTSWCNHALGHRSCLTFTPSKTLEPAAGGTNLIHVYRHRLFMFWRKVNTLRCCVSTHRGHERVMLHEFTAGERRERVCVWSVQSRAYWNSSNTILYLVNKRALSASISFSRCKFELNKTVC